MGAELVGPSIAHLQNGGSTCPIHITDTLIVNCIVFAGLAFHPITTPTGIFMVPCCENLLHQIKAPHPWAFWTRVLP